MAEEQITVTEETENITPENIKNLVKCPCCGKMTLKRPLTPNQQFSDHWLACMMSGVPFNHTYPLYNGKLLITLTQLSSSEASDIESICTALDILMDKQGGYIDGVDILQIRNMARLFVGIKDITVKGVGDSKQVFRPADTVQEAAKLIREVKPILSDMEKKSEWLPVLSKAYAMLTDTANVSSVPVQLLIAIEDTHSRLNSIMLDLGFDENFWKGIELA